ncbi:hypothetical protein MKX01_003910 [Papaver californicum]|nr:hypothetical protein MKX01_003910 [Papaver californicum]
MSRVTRSKKNKRSKSEEEKVGTTSEICKRICATGDVTKDDIDHLYYNPNCFCALIPHRNGFRKTGLWQKMSDVLLNLGPDSSQDLRAANWPAGWCLYMNSYFRAGVFAVELELLKQYPVLDQLAKLFSQLHSSYMAFIYSAPFIKTLELNNGVQQDSHEFLNLLLSLLERFLSRSKVSNARTIVEDLFRGSVSHVTRCSNCGLDSEASSKMEDFYDIELNIKGFNSLDKSLEDYLSVEKICGDNQYFCESCDFLPKTTTVKRITYEFSFPGELQMKQRLHEPSQSELTYELSAILVHKGTGVNSGHYVSIIKDECTREWWEFDDELVSKLGSHPFGEGSSSSTAKPMDIDCHGKTFTSADAYMLMYHRKTTTSSKDKAFKDTERSSESVPQHDNKSLPVHLFEEIKVLNESYATTCQNYQQEKERQTVRISEQRQEVSSILSEAPVTSLEEPYFWIATDWLHKWADNIAPPVLENTSIQCSHGGVPVSKVGSMKRLSERAWTRLLSKYGGGPTLSNGDLCIDCLRDRAKTMVRADDYRDQRSSFKELQMPHLLGSFWMGCCTIKNVDFPCEADFGPTASIRCPHGELMPEQASGATRVLVPEDLWLFLYENSNKVKVEGALVCSTFLSDAETCAICSVELNEMACAEDTPRAAKLKERQNHEKLLLGKNNALNPGCKYYLLPSSWLTKWRSYVTASAKNVSSSVGPDPLDDVIDSLTCEKHGQLLERPLDLICERVLYFRKNDWKFFCEDWQGANSKCVSAEIELSSVSCEEMPTSEAYLNSSNHEVESRQPTIKTYPMICDECIGERESRELMQKLSYCNEDISVVLVRGNEEAPKSVLDPSCAVSEPRRRTFKRTWKKSYGNSVNLKVSSSMSVDRLKMMIWESFGVVKENQMLHKGRRLIEEESATLADMNIFPGDRLWVRDTELHENRDIADEVSRECSEVKTSEEGFRGTLLTGMKVF